MKNSLIKAVSIIAALCLCFSLFSGCGNKSGNATNPTRGTYSGYISDFTFEQVEQKGVLKFITTLPVDTRLTVELDASYGVYQKSKSVKVVEKDSKRYFITDAYNNNGNQLNDGNYIVQITLNAPSSQDSKVQSTIGKKGEALGGVNVFEKDGEVICKEILTLSLKDGIFVKK